MPTHEPYVGPRPFQLEDQKVFFGRTQEADKLVSLITAHPAVVLYAPSGAGKTSLLNAYLIPLLQKKGFDVLPTVRVQCHTQFNVLFEKIENIYAFNSMMNWTKGEGDQSLLAQQSLNEFLKEQRQIKARSQHDVEVREEPAPRVVIFDQFEEIFTLYPERWKDRQGFFEQVREALEACSTFAGYESSRTSKENAEPLLRVLFVMREDYIAGLDSYAHLLPEKLRTRFRLEHLREKSALLAVTEPLKETTRSYDKGVAEQLVENLLKIRSTNHGGEWESGQYVEPVQLQVVCQSMWLALKPDQDTITREHLEKYGDVNQALSGFYERSVKEVAEGTGVEEGDIRRWFGKQLIRPEGVRGIVFRGDLLTATLTNEAVDELEKLHLIKGELRGSARWYELAHDRLIEPIKQSNEKWLAGLDVTLKALELMEVRAQNWDAKGRDAAGLLTEGELYQVGIWRDCPEAASFVPSKEFSDLIQASRSARSARRTRVLVGVLVMAIVLLLGMSVVTVFAINQRRNALNKEADARAAQIKVTAQNEELLEKQAEVDIARNNLDMKVVELKAKNTELETKSKELQGAKQTLVAKNTELQDAQTSLVTKNEELGTTNTKLITNQGELTKKTGELSDLNIELKKKADALQESNEYLNGQRYLSDKELKISQSRQLAYNSKETLASKVDPELSQRLAFEAANLAPTIEAADALRAVMPSISAVPSVELVGHSRRLIGAVFSPDGQFVVTTSDDGTARIWEAINQGKQVAELKVGDGKITSASFSQDSRLIVTGSDDDVARVWETRTGKLLQELKGHTASVAVAIFSPDETLVATEALDTTGKIWNISSGKALHTLDGLRGPVTAIAFSPNGKLLVSEGQSGSDDNPKYEARVWEVATGRLVRLLAGHTNAITAIAFSPDGTFLTTTSRDKTARVWNTTTWESEVLQPNVGVIASAAFSPDGNSIVLVGQSAQIVNLGSGGWTLGKQLLGHTGSVVSAAFSSSSQLVVTAGFDNTAIVWDVNTGKQLAVLRGHAGGIVSVSFIPTRNKELILTASQDKTARLWDFSQRFVTTATSQIKTVFPAPDSKVTGHEDVVTSSTFSPDNRHFLTTSRDGTARIWDASTGNVSITISTSESAGNKSNPGVNRSALSSDGKLIVAACEDGNTLVWESGTGKLRKTLTGHRGEVISAAFSPDQSQIVTAGDDGTARIWEWQNESVVNQPIVLDANKTTSTNNASNTDEKKPALLDAAFSPDGRRVVTASTDGTARLWDARTGELIQTFGIETPTAPLGEVDRVVISADFSPDGKYIITGHGDGNARVWNADAGADSKPFKELSCHKGPVYFATFSPDNEFIVTAGEDKTVRVWSTKTWRNVAILRGHASAVTYAAFSPDSQLIVTASDDRTSRIYTRDSFEPIATLLVKARQRGLTGLTDPEKLDFLSAHCK